MSALPTIGYAGMTHLGLCSAVACASKGFRTLGFDENAASVDRLNAGQLPLVEPALDELLHANRDRLSFSADSARLADCDVIYVAPDVPTDDRGDTVLAGVDRLLDVTRARSRPDAVIVVLSQVPPGFTRVRHSPQRPLYYQVETLVFGRAVERATRPERIILGCADPDAALPRALATYLEAFGCPILSMRFESAELTKASINCCLVASVTMANTLAEICERIGADWSEIAPAVKLDRRIGAFAYLSPGLGLAGGNLERDLATVLRLSAEHGTEAGAISSFVANSAYRKDWALRVLHQALLSARSDATVAVLGLAYKENTDSVKNSPALALIDSLATCTLRVFDPVVPASAAAGRRVIGARSPLEAAAGADALAIMTPWPQFGSLACEDIAKVMRGRLVLDPYRVLDAAAARAARFDYRTLGLS